METPEQAAGEAASAVHVVKAGETLYGIARAHNLRIEQLREWNGLRSDALAAGQRLALRAPEQREAPSVASAQQREAPSVAAAQQREAPPAVAAQQREAPPAVAAQQPVPAMGKVYVVQQGDTLYSISRKLGVSIGNLHEWNDIGGVLRVGQQIQYR